MKTHMFTRLIIGWFVIVFICSGNLALGKVFYVSSAGDDSNDGLSESAPFQTLSKVNTVINSGDTALFRRGDIFRGQLDIVSKANVTVGAYGSGDDPVIAGSILIKNWNIYQGNIYVADVSGIISPGQSIPHLFVNNQLMTIARYPNVDSPNGGWLNVGTSTDKKTFTDPAIAGKPDGYWNGATLRIRTFSWLFEIRTVSNYLSNGTIILNKELTQTLAAIIQPGWGYYLDNKLTELDHENEWFFDPTNLKIYLWAPGGQNPNHLKVEAAIYSIGIKLFWKSHDAKIEHITFRHQTQDGVNINQCDRTTIRNCRFEYCIQKGISTWNAIDFNFDSNSFERCLDYAIMVNGNISAGNSVISRNSIRDTAMVPGYGGDGVTHSIAIRIYGATNIQLKNNTIENTGYVALMLEGGGHVVENNVIKKSQLTLDDGGAIYINSHNNQIRSNIISESWGNRDASSGTHNGNYFRQMGMGIFFSSKCSGNVIEGNTISDNVDYGLYPDRASNTTIRNNIFYNNRIHLYLKGETGDTLDNKYQNTIEGNTYYAISPNQYCLRVDGKFDFGTFQRNIYCNPYSDIVIKEDNSTSGFPVYSLSHWQQQYKNRDQDSTGCGLSLKEYLVSDAGGNLISNSFFTDNISGWTISGDASIRHDPSNVNMDGGSLKNTFSGTVDSKVRPTNFQISQNQFYRLSFSAIANRYGNIRVMIYNESIGGAWVEYVERFFSIGPYRKDYNFIFQWQFQDSTSKPYFITTKNDPSEYWLDNVIFQPVTATKLEPKLYSILYTNPSETDASIEIGNQRYYDIHGNTIWGKILLKPFESKILIRDDTIEKLNLNLSHAVTNLQILSGNLTVGLDADKNFTINLYDILIILQTIAGIR